MRIGSSSHKVAAFLLALALLIQPALAEVSKLDRYTVCIVDEQNNGSVVTEKVWFEDARGGYVVIGEPQPALADSVGALIDGLKPGEMNASKSGRFASVEDAAAGIAEITFDVVGIPVNIPRDIACWLIQVSLWTKLGWIVS